MHHTGKLEYQLEKYVASRYPRAKAKDSRKNNPPRILQVVFTAKEHFRAVIEEADAFIGAFWLKAETANPPKLRIIQCYECLNFGHISFCPQTSKVGVADTRAENRNTRMALNPKKNGNAKTADKIKMQPLWNELFF